MIEFASFHLTVVLLSALFLVVATVYSSVGLGGGSSYTAFLALFGVSAAQIAPTALALNLVVAGIAFYAFLRKGFVRWSLLLPIVVVSVPASFLGGGIGSTFGASTDSKWWVRRIAGVILLVAAIQIFIQLMG